MFIACSDQVGKQKEIGSCYRSGNGICYKKSKKKA